MSANPKSASAATTPEAKNVPTALKTLFVFALGAAWLLAWQFLSDWSLLFLVGTAIGTCLIVGAIRLLRYVKADPDKKDIRVLYVIIAVLALMVVSLTIAVIGVPIYIVATIGFGALSSLLFVFGVLINRT